MQRYSKIFSCATFASFFSIYSIALKIVHQVHLTAVTACKWDDCLVHYRLFLCTNVHLVVHQADMYPKRWHFFLITQRLIPMTRWLITITRLVAELSRWLIPITRLVAELSDGVSTKFSRELSAISAPGWNISLSCSDNPATHPPTVALSSLVQPSRAQVHQWCTIGSVGAPANDLQVRCLGAKGALGAPFFCFRLFSRPSR